MKKEVGSNFRRFGLIGKNIGYSFSPQYFKKKFENEQIAASYKLFDLSHLNQFPNVFMTPNLAGLNVTIPYKEEVMMLLDEISPEAKAIGAVNTIQMKGQRLKGFNTDWIGFKKSIQPFIQDQHNHALILGTGGASKAVQYAFNDLKISFKTVSRHPNKGDYLYSDLNQNILGECQIIVNTTPLGNHPNLDLAPDIPFQYITAQHLVYDLIYNPTTTKLLQLAQNQGATTKNGLEMLQIQAEESWKIWNS